MSESLSPPRDPASVDISAYQAWLFDMDGVLTKTADVHAAAWKQAFDAFLGEESQRTGKTYAPFDSGEDYQKYVDGEPRADGVRNFLAARGITLPEGNDDDPPGARTVNGVGNRKNQLVLEVMKTQGVAVYDGAVALVKELRRRGIKVAVVSASENTQAALQAAGIERPLRRSGGRTRRQGTAPRRQARAGQFLRGRQNARRRRESRRGHRRRVSGSAGRSLGALRPGGGRGQSRRAGSSRSTLTNSTRTAPTSSCVIFANCSVPLADRRTRLLRAHSFGDVLLRERTVGEVFANAVVIDRWSVLGQLGLTDDSHHLDLDAHDRPVAVGRGSARRVDRVATPGRDPLRSDR
jgi:beta-phosphoglucomutase-like phosphatase (HAD superfamily)